MDIYCHLWFAKRDINFFWPMELRGSPDSKRSAFPSLLVQDESIPNDAGGDGVQNPELDLSAAIESCTFL